MIPGFNLDIKHKGKTFHIQTEDSGPQNPVIMTHLFIFGTILGTRRLEYGQAADRPDLADHVRELMRAELREMHRALLNGEFDELAHRPAKKVGGSEIPLARKSGAPVAPAPASMEGFPADENTALVSPPAGLRPRPPTDPLGTLDVEDLIDISDQAESVYGDEDGSVIDEDLVSIVEEQADPVPAAAALEGMAPGGAFPDRTTLPARLTASATPVRAPRANVEFPTDLVAEVRFDDVILAWLLEDVDEP